MYLLNYSFFLLVAKTAERKWACDFGTDVVENTMLPCGMSNEGLGTRFVLEQEVDLNVFAQFELDAASAATTSTIWTDALEAGEIRCLTFKYKTEGNTNGELMLHDGDRTEIWSFTGKTHLM